jgi:DNA-directed RNA polymerase specialized sigma24 family protein
VVLRHVAGLSIAEISETTGRPEGTVKADVHRGLARLRKTIEGET